MASLSELLGGVFEGLANVFERRFARSERRRNRDTEPKVRVAIEDPATPAIRELLEEHLREMRSITRADRVFALDVDALRKPDVAFFAARRDGVLVGCGALKTLDATHGEIKSMRTAPAARRSGVAFAVLDRIVEDARARGLKRLSLETGAARPFHGARKLYSGYGFVRCGPFGAYPDVPTSVFMTLDIEKTSKPSASAARRSADSQGRVPPSS